MSGASPLQGGGEDLLSSVIDVLVERVAHRVAELVMDQNGRTSGQVQGEEDQQLDVDVAARYLPPSRSTIYALSTVGKIPEAQLVGRQPFGVEDLEGGSDQTRRLA